MRTVRSPPLRVILSFNDVEKCNVKQDLVAIVPAVESTVPGIVVQHRHVEILVMKGYVCILISGGFSGVGIVHLGSGQVGISNV